MIEAPLSAKVVRAINSAQSIDELETAVAPYLAEIEKLPVRERDRLRGAYRARISELGRKP